jgi:hypothetical protein
MRVVGLPVFPIGGVARVIGLQFVVVFRLVPYLFLSCGVYFFY